MKLAFKSAAVAIALSIAAISSASAQDRSQLIAAAGLTAAEAQGLTLNEIYVRKINRESGPDGRQGVFVRAAPVTIDAMRHAQLAASAGLMPLEAAGLSLNEIASIKASHNTRRDDRQVFVSTRSMGMVDIAEHAQLIAAAGLTPAEARGLTIGDLYVRKINREASRDQRQF